MKIISIKTIDKIILYDFKIFDAEDSFIPDRKVASRFDNKRWEILEKEGYTREEKHELIDNIKWYVDLSIIKLNLEKLGWKIK